MTRRKTKKVEREVAKKIEKEKRVQEMKDRILKRGRKP
jgi:hypothetical protein